MSKNKVVKRVVLEVRCGNNSVVECQLPKLKVAGPNPVSRSIKSKG